MGVYLPVSFDPSDPLFVRCLGIEDDPAQARWGPGYRDYYILHYVLGGKGYFNDAPVSVDQGFFISSHQLQEYHSDTEKPWNYFWIIFSEAFAQKYVLPILKPDDRHIFSYNFRGKLQNLWLNVLQSRSCLSHTEALSLLFHLISLHESAGEPGPGSPPLQHVKDAKSYIEYNFDKKISVGDVAAAVHVDERYLYNLFIKYEGISPKEYINRQRYAMACRLLTSTSLTVSEIAYATGFADVCTFSRFFAKGMGMSPTKYRLAFA